jgi:hypothetical protein
LDATRRRSGVTGRDDLAGLYRPGVAGDAEPTDLAAELEARDELLMACRELLLSMGTARAAALVAHINATLDLDDGFSPTPQPPAG